MHSSAVPIRPPEARATASAFTWFICFLLAHHLAVFVHEYAHSFMAFALGYKSNPFLIHFGGTGPLNLLLLAASTSTSTTRPCSPKARDGLLPWWPCPGRALATASATLDRSR